MTASWDIDGFTLAGEPYAETTTGSWVTRGYFTLLGLKPALGRPFHDAEYLGPDPVAIVSHDLWMRRFNGNPGVVGKVVRMHSVDRADAPSLVTIVGVLPKNAWPIQWRESNVLRPMAVQKQWPPQLARLAANTSRRESEERLTAVVRAQITGPVDSSWRMELVSALESHSQRVRPLLIAVLGAAAFMFLAACGSVAGALIGRTASRYGELSIRLALGGSRARVVDNFSPRALCSRHWAAQSDC